LRRARRTEGIGRLKVKERKKEGRNLLAKGNTDFAKFGKVVPL